MTVLNMTPGAALVALLLVVAISMLVGAGLALEVVARRAPAPAPVHVRLGAAGPTSVCGCCGCQKWLCACVCCCGRVATTPFPAAEAPLMSEWLAELAAAHRQAEQATRWLVVTGEQAIPPRWRR